MTIGEKIRYFRKRIGITQEELGNRADLHTVSIRKYEIGKMVPQYAQIERLAKALDINRSALIGIDESQFSMSSVGDLLGMIITLCQANVLSFSGDRGEDGILNPKTVRITLSPMLSTYCSAQIEQTDTSPMPLNSIAFTLNTSPFIPTLLQWEKEFSQFRTLQNTAYNRPTIDLLEELEECRTRKEILELELQSQKDKLIWPDGLAGSVM